MPSMSRRTHRNETILLDQNEVRSSRRLRLKRKTLPMPEEQPTKNDPILSNLPPPPPLQMSPMILTAAESKYPKKSRLWSSLSPERIMGGLSSGMSTRRTWTVGAVYNPPSRRDATTVREWPADGMHGRPVYQSSTMSTKSKADVEAGGHHVFHGVIAYVISEAANTSKGSFPNGKKYFHCQLDTRGPLTAVVFQFSGLVLCFRIIQGVDDDEDEPPELSVELRRSFSKLIDEARHQTGKLTLPKLTCASVARAKEWEVLCEAMSICVSIRQCFRLLARALHLRGQPGHLQATLEAAAQVYCTCTGCQQSELAAYVRSLTPQSCLDWVADLDSSLY